MPVAVGKVARVKRTRSWEELSTWERRAIVVAASIELALTTVALVDLARRPTGLVRGPKLRWAVVCFVQPVGPIAYLAFGRR
jgi:Phospholipase_D-nuclease N-terminal